MRSPHAVPSVLFFAMVLGVGPSNAAAQAGIRVHQVERVRVDGALGDWRDATFAEVGRGDDASMRFAIGANDDGLFLAAEVRDDRMVRTARPGTHEDAVVLTLSIPRGRRPQVSDIYLFAGVSGRSAGSAGLANRVGGRPHPIRGARVVEGPRRSGRGYVIEAFIPFARIPGGARWDSAHANVRLRDVDSESHPEVEAEPAVVTEGLVPLMPSGGASGQLEQFLAAHGLGATRPRFDLRGDVSGDRRPERVFVVDRFVLITGPGYRDGRSYSFHQLAITRGSDARSAALRDLTGDGKAELVVVIRQRNEQGERDLWQVLSLSGERPTPIFGIEVRKAMRGGSIEARVRILRGRGGRPPEVEVRAGRARGLDASVYHEAPATDVQPILLPWGPVRSRRFRWRGGSFVQTSEQANPRYRAPAPAAPATPRGGPAAPTPTGPSVDDLLAAFRRGQGISQRARPTYHFRTNIAGGREPERALVYGRRLVVVGPGIQGGRSWLFYEIPAASDADVIDVRAADVTGDHRAELLFTIRQHLGDVTRDILVVHQVRPTGFPRLLQVEIARRQGSAFVRNAVVTRGGRLELRPGRSREWGEGAWPFGQAADGSVEPLLLPWRDRAARYRLSGARLVH